MTNCEVEIAAAAYGGLAMTDDKGRRVEAAQLIS